MDFCFFIYFVLLLFQMAIILSITYTNMYSTKQHIVRKSLIVLVSFIWGIATTVLASAFYDANVQSRATKMFTAITNNANQLDPKDVPTYYNLVHLNIQSLMQVLTSVDTSVMAALSQTSIDDDTVAWQVSDVTPAAPGIHWPNPVSRSTSESYMMSWTWVAWLDYYIAIDANISTGGNKATGTSWTIPLTGLTPGSTHTGALKACAANTAICSTWSTVTINIGEGELLDLIEHIFPQIVRKSRSSLDSKVSSSNTACHHA